MNARYIYPNQLRNVWEFVKQGLEKVRAKGHDDWIVEDIYCDCFTQKAMLWIVSDDNNDDNGFMVLQPMGKTLHVWAAWLESNNPDDVVAGFNHIKEIAKQGGCKKVTFTSVRKGWERHARKIGCKPLTWGCEL
jgi:hypothetical protein